MSTRVLIDNFTGDPEAFYALVIDEVNQRALSDIEYKWVEEAESEKRFFNKGDKVKALRVAFGTKEWIVVLAYQLGNCFYVSARSTHRFSEPGTYLIEVLIYTFETVVDRAIKKALARHMEANGSSIPGFLAVNDNIPVSQESTS
jgi:hypothetical protein